MDPLTLWRAWPVAGPWTLSRLAGGTNNAIWRADASDGQRYALRIVRDRSQEPALRYEAQLLGELARLPLSFAVPAPIPTISSDALYVSDGDEACIAILTPLLPGLPPARTDLAVLPFAARALGELDLTLASLSASASLGDPFLPPMGALNRWFPLDGDPQAALDSLPLDGDGRAAMRMALELAQSTASEMYSRLPQQLVHRDFDATNILMEGSHVTAVLDFEFAAWDLRVLDLAIAMSWWPYTLLGTGREWEVIDPLGRAYMAVVPLTSEELAALPDALRLRDAVSFVHRMGRYLTGQDSLAALNSRAEVYRTRERWLVAEAETLRAHASTWSGSSRE